MSNRPRAGRKGNKQKTIATTVPWGWIVAGVAFVALAGLTTWLILRRGPAAAPVVVAADSPTPAAPAPIAPMTPVAPVRARPAAATNERPAAEKLLAMGASLVITDSTGSPLFVTQLNQLPETLHITGLLLGDCQQLTPEHGALIAGLVWLTDLQLARAKITDEWFAALAPLTTLTTVNVEDTALTAKSLPVLAKLTSLTFLALTLDLSDNDLAGLTTLTKLQQLRCVGSNVTNTGLKSICTACPDLTHFVTDQLAITDAGLEAVAGLPKLRLLGLMRAPITDGGVATFQRLRTLTHLLIPGTQVTRAGTVQIREALPHCQVFGGKYDIRRVIAARVLSSGGQVTLQIAGQEARTVTQLDELPEEEFTCQAITLAGATPPEQWTLGDLLLADTQSLSLQGAKIDIRQMAEISARAPQLKHLDLSQTLAGDALVEPLSKLQALHSIDVQQTRFTGNGLVDLRMRLFDGCDVLDGEEYDRTQDRRVAEAIVQLGGNVTLVEPGGKVTSAATVTNLPENQFWVRGIYFNSISEVNDAWVANLVGLRQLSSFASTSCKLSDGTMASLAKIPSLQTIDISWQTDPITDAGMVSLANLRHLSGLQMHSTARIGPVGIKKMGALPSIAQLALGGGPFGEPLEDESIRLIADQYPNLTSLVLWTNFVTDSGTADLVRLRKLQYLDLLGSQKLTPDGLSQILDLPNLENLTPGIGKLPKNVALKLFTHPKLTYIFLKECQIEDGAFDSLIGRVGRAGSISLSPNSIPANLVKQIRQTNPMLILNLGDRHRRDIVRVVLEEGGTVTLSVVGQAKPVVLKQTDSLPDDDFDTINIDLTGVPYFPGNRYPLRSSAYYRLCFGPTRAL